MKKGIIKGNEKDCICDKPNGKHTRYCDAYRLSEFFKKCVNAKISLTPLSTKQIKYEN